MLVFLNISRIETRGEIVVKIKLYDKIPICWNIDGNLMKWIALSLRPFNFWLDKFYLFFRIFRYIKVSYVAIARNSSRKSVTWKPISNQYTESQNGNFTWLLYILKKMNLKSLFYIILGIITTPNSLPMYLDKNTILSVLFAQKPSP